MILYVPRSSVTVERDFSINAGLLASTETPGRTAPLWSLTTPVNVLCARVSGTRAVKYSNDTKTPIVRRLVLVFLITLLLSLKGRSFCHAWAKIRWPLKSTSIAVFIEVEGACISRVG